MWISLRQRRVEHWECEGVTDRSNHHRSLFREISWCKRLRSRLEFGFGAYCSLSLSSKHGWRLVIPCCRSSPLLKVYDQDSIINVFLLLMWRIHTCPRECSSKDNKDVSYFNMCLFGEGTENKDRDRLLH